MPLDHEGLHVDSASSITLWTGTRFDVLDPRACLVYIEDIAHALARQCRYNGHVTGFLSVARHSIWVSEELRGSGCELWGLLHDAAETYIGDMVKPLKHDPSMQPFLDIEERIEETIAEAFGLPYPMPDAVREADRVVTVEKELGPPRLRHRWKSSYERDEADFLIRYQEVQDGR